MVPGYRPQALPFTLSGTWSGSLSPITRSRPPRPRRSAPSSFTPFPDVYPDKHVAAHLHPPVHFRKPTLAILLSSAAKCYLLLNATLSPCLSSKPPKGRLWCPGLSRCWAHCMLRGAVLPSDPCRQPAWVLMLTHQLGELEQVT